MEPLSNHVVLRISRARQNYVYKKAQEFNANLTISLPIIVIELVLMKFSTV